MEAKIEKKPLEGKFKTWRMRLWKIRDRRLIHYKAECTEWDQCIGSKIKLELDISQLISLDFYPRSNPKPNQLVIKHPELAHGGVLMRFNDKDTEQDTVASWLKVLTAWSVDKAKNRVYVAIPSNFAFAIWNVLNALYDHPDLLKSEGIFRKETTETRVKHQFCNDLLYEKISAQQLKAGYNMYIDYDNDIYLLANSLKYLLTMLPSSIFGDHNFEDLLRTFQSINIGDENEDIEKVPRAKLEKLKAAIDRMYNNTRYKHRYGLICLILHLLKRVINETTRMTYEGMAKMFAVCFESKVYTSTSLLTNPLSQFRSVPLVHILIFHAYYLFPTKQFKMEDVVVADEEEAKMLERYHELKELHLPKKAKKRLKMQRMKSADSVFHPTQFFDANSTIADHVMRSKDDTEKTASPSPPLRPPPKAPPRKPNTPEDAEEEEQKEETTETYTETYANPSDRMAQENKKLHIKTLKLQSQMDKVKAREKDLKFKLKEKEEQCSALEEQITLKSQMAQKLHQQVLNTQNLNDMLSYKMQELEDLLQQKESNIESLQDTVDWMKDRVLAAPVAPSKHEVFYDHDVHGMSLEQKLKQRPSLTAMQQKGIIMDDDDHRKIHRRKASNTLDKMLVNRPDKKKLQDINILKKANENNKEELNLNLNNKLAQRPDWREVQQRGILLDNPTQSHKEQARKRKAHKRNASQTINTLLKTRPDPEQLQSKNIIDSNDITFFGGENHGDTVTRQEIAQNLSKKLAKRPSMDETMAKGILLYRTDTNRDNIWDEDRKELENEIAQLKDEITELKEHTDELDEVNEKLKSLEDEHQTRETAAAQELETSRKQIEDDAMQLALLKEEKQRILSEYDNAKEKGDKYHEEVTQLQERIKELEANTNKTQSIEDEYKAAQERLQSLEVTAQLNVNLQSELAFYKTEKERIETKIIEQENTLEETKQLNTELQETVRNQKKKIQRLSQAFNVADIEDINNFPEMQQEKEDEWKQEVNRLKDQLTHQQMEKSMLQEEKKKLLKRLSVAGYLRNDLNQDEDDDDMHEEEIITKQKQIFKNERSKINSKMSSNSEYKYVSLHEFECNDVYNVIKWWKYNDVDYEKDLERTMKILVNHRLHGDTIHSLRSFNIKTMIRNELKSFMTDGTIAVMLECLEEWMRIENEDTISGRNAAEIGHMLYHYPLNKVLDKVMSDKIDGEKFKKYYKENNAFIRRETGWKQMEIYQIESILFQHESMNKHEFIENMDRILVNNKYKDEIKKTILEFNVGSIHSHFKRAQTHDDFNEKVTNTVNELEDESETVYSLIAQCFIWNDDKMKTGHGSSLRQFDWKCFNCGNDNFCAMIAGKRNIDLSRCTLCGITQKKSILLNLANCTTYLSLNQASDHDTKDDGDDDIDEWMVSVIRDNKLNLLCFYDNEENPCSAMMRLGKCLIKYKRWLDTIGDESDKRIDYEIFIEGVEKDYHHILKYHINRGDEQVAKMVFLFFSNVLHCSDITKCTSCIRRKKRVKQQVLSEQKESKTYNDVQDKDILTLKEYYIQSYLDVMHSYLVHFDWKRFIGKKQQEINIEDGYDFGNKDKFVTDYGRGVGYDHSYLSPKHESIRTEISVSHRQFQDVLTKAIKLHSIALSDIYKHELYCKYFDLEYNIIRNEAIGIRHILVLVMYTDLSSFTSAFRSTYTKRDNEIGDDQVTSRHRELYYYSRALFEAVEFFGTNMTQSVKVYHGLTSYLQSTNVNFKELGAYFNQPISSSSYYEVAYRFANGKGVILSLSADASSVKDSIAKRKIPKYLSVSWLSLFPEEEEKLIYGDAVMLQIQNIIESKNMNGHEMELQILHKFQRLLHNEDIVWNLNDKIERFMVEDLVILIKTEQKLDDEIDDEMEENYITDYGKELFHRFCSNIARINIKNPKTLPKDIFNALFIDSTHKLSLLPIMSLFRSLEQMIFNDLNLVEFVTNSNNYVNAAIQCIDVSHNDKLEKIAFQSSKQNDGKQNTALKKLAKRFSDISLNKTEWKMKYHLKEGQTHSLVLTHNEYCSIKGMKQCTVKQMVYLVKQICDGTEDLMDHTQVFVSWIEENNIDGTAFLKYKEETAFTEAIALCCNNDDTLRTPSLLLFEELKRFNFTAKFAETFTEETERERMENALIVAELASVEREDKLKKEEQRVTILQRELNNVKKSMEAQQAMKQEINQLREGKEKRKKIEDHLEIELAKVSAKNEEYKQQSKAFEQEKLSILQSKLDITTKYKEKEDILHEEMNALQQNYSSLEEEVVSLKENQDKCIEQIDSLTQSKMTLVISTSTEIDALRHEIKMYNERNWNGLISDIENTK